MATLQLMTTAAVNAARQWHYAPPAEGPLAFTVGVPVEPSMAASSGPAAAPSPNDSGWEMSQGALRVGGGIKPPAKLVHVNPVYPAIAQASRVQGVVIIEA